MSTSRSPSDLDRGMQGQYTLHNRAIFKQAWRKLCGFKASFWGAFILGFLALLLINCTVYIGFFLSVLLTKAVINQGAILPFVSLLYLMASLLFLILETALNALFFISLTYLSLQWLRKQPIKVTHIFEFRHHWKPLIGLALIFSVTTSIFSFVKVIGLASSNVLLYASSANIVTWFSFFMWLGFYLFFITVLLFAFLYGLLLFSFAALLCFDKKTTDIKTSLQMVFKALNAQLTSHLLLLLLAILIFMFGVFLTLGMAVIWLLPWFFLVIAWQYQTIFGERNHEMPENDKNSAVIT